MRISLGRSAAGLASLSIAIGLAACGSDSNDTASKTPAANAQSSAIQLPAEIKKKGEIVVAADASYAPNEFIRPGGKQVVGADADLAKAIAQKLGVTVKIQNASFDGIIPGIAAGKYDLGMSSFTDTKEREKTVDFVTYFSAGTSFYITTVNAQQVNSLSDLCGLSVAVEKGTTQQTDAEAQAKKCKVSVLVYPDQNGVNLALSSGRADVAMADSPVAAYQVEQSQNKFRLSGDPYGTAPYGIAIKKNSGLDQPVLEAVKAIMADGTYKSILEQWGIQKGAIKNPVINGAQS